MLMSNQMHYPCYASTIKCITLVRSNGLLLLCRHAHILALEIFLYFVKVALGGPAFGYLMAKITIFWLSHVFNDALVEITITLASTYITFYIGEGLFEVSGVLAVVTLGIELNSRRTSISPEVETFLHRYVRTEKVYYTIKIASLPLIIHSQQWA